MYYRRGAGRCFSNRTTLSLDATLPYLPICCALLPRHRTGPDFSASQSGTLAEFSRELIDEKGLATIASVSDHKSDLSSLAGHPPDFTQAQIHVQEIPPQHAPDPRLLDMLDASFQPFRRRIVAGGRASRPRLGVRVEALVSKLAILVPIEKLEHQLHAENPSIVMSVGIRRRCDHRRICRVAIRKGAGVREISGPTGRAAGCIVLHIQQHRFHPLPKRFHDEGSFRPRVGPSQPASVRDRLAEPRDDGEQSEPEESSLRRRAIESIDPACHRIQRFKPTMRQRASHQLRVTFRPGSSAFSTKLRVEHAPRAFQRTSRKRCYLRGGRQHRERRQVP